jgi:5'-3' exonuclease
MACDWLLIDGSSLIFRAFHGIPRTVRSPDGHPVNAVRGFMDTLARLVSTRQPRHLAVAGDADWRPAWRVELIPSYKEHRTAEPVPPGLEPQMPVVMECLAAVGIDAVGVAGYEAEDVIATWTARAEGTVEISSGDRDLFALIEDPRVCILYPEKAGLTVVTEAEVTRRYGIPGRSYADFAMLRGDPSDGLPGLKGVGAVAAADLVRRHGGVAGVLADARLTDGQRQYLAAALGVVPPVPDLPVELPPGRRDAYPVDGERLTALTERLGLGSATERLLAALVALTRQPPSD